MPPRTRQDRRGGMAGKNNQWLLVPAHWRACIPSHGGDPASRQPHAPSWKYCPTIPGLYDALTICVLFCTQKGLRQGCTSWLSPTATYLCTLSLFWPFYKGKRIQGWASGYGRWGV